MFRPFLRVGSARIAFLRGFSPDLMVIFAVSAIFPRSDERKGSVSSQQQANRTGNCLWRHQVQPRLQALPTEIKRQGQRRVRTCRGGP